MPRRIELWNQHLAIEKGHEPDPAPPNGGTGVRDTWTLVMSDRVTREETRLTINREMRDWLVRELTGGVILAGGDLPQI